MIRKKTVNKGALAGFIGAVAVLLVAFGVSGLGRRINSKH